MRLIFFMITHLTLNDLEHTHKSSPEAQNEIRIGYTIV